MIKHMESPVILIRGAGELATGVAWTLASAGYRIIMTEVAQPLMVRWPVCFGSAVSDGNWTVEGIQAERVDTLQEIGTVWQNGRVPVLIDPLLEKLADLKVDLRPRILIDAIMAKRNLGTQRSQERLTIGLGPGFTAGVDVDLVVETNRGHNLGRLIYSGPAEPNTGIPGEIGGVFAERVVYSQQSGSIRVKREIGDYVEAGDSLGEIIFEAGSYEVKATISGVLRGLLREGTFIQQQVKIGDIDPRGKREYCWTISEKVRTIGTALLLAVVKWERNKF